MAVSVNQVAKRVHNLWLKQKPREYSPLNKPWSDLLPEQRRDVSRQVRETMNATREEGYELQFIDEYDAPGPGDARWSDPETKLGNYIGGQDQCAKQPVGPMRERCPQCGR